MQIEFARCLEEDDIVHVHKDMGKMKESRLTRSMISLKVKKEKRIKLYGNQNQNVSADNITS